MFRFIFINISYFRCFYIFQYLKENILPDNVSQLHKLLGIVVLQYVQSDCTESRNSRYFWQFWYSRQFRNSRKFRGFCDSWQSLNFSDFSKSRDYGQSWNSEHSLDSRHSRSRFSTDSFKIFDLLDILDSIEFLDSFIITEILAILEFQATLAILDILEILDSFSWFWLPPVYHSISRPCDVLFIFHLTYIF